jgi:ubiquinone/menaquinone biosynthesis C-methylase UbiE
VEAEAWDAGAEAWVARVAEAQWEAHDASIRELLPPPTGLTFDVGCGEGRWTRMLEGAGYDVVGLDRSAALIDVARRAHPAGRYGVCSIDALPAGDGAVDLVLCSNVLPHVVDLRLAAQELARVLRKGGVLVAGHRHPVAEAGACDTRTGELRVDRYFDREPHAVPLGNGLVFHQHRTLEDYVRMFAGVGFALGDLREVADPGGSSPAYLDLRLVRR